MYESYIRTHTKNNAQVEVHIDYPHSTPLRTRTVHRTFCNNETGHRSVSACLPPPSLLQLEPQQQQSPHVFIEQRADTAAVSQTEEPYVHVYNEQLNELIGHNKRSVSCTCATPKHLAVV